MTQELSIEEKAKRYDNAIERAIKHRNNDGLTLEQYETIDIILPELAESEDEKIKRAIRGWIYTRPASFFDNGISKEKILAWLEKRGERPTNEEMKELLRTEYEKGRADAIAEMQKQEWSTDDENMFEFALNMIEWYSGVNEDKSRPISNWLKTLKNRIQLQPKREWNKEDEEIIEALNYYVKNLDIFFSGIKIGDKNIQSKEFREKVQHWLKFLKDRVNYETNFATPWKPSDKQMKVLNDINLTGCVSYAGQGQELIDLYNDLKKLREK